MKLKDLNNLLNYYNENYEIIADFDLINKITLGEKNIHCRFCGENYPDVKFKNVAHAIPEALDNNRLFSYYECDNCNHEFGEIIEDHLSKYLFPYRIGSIILGKKGKISYKIDENNRLDVCEGHWEIKESIQNSILDIIDDHTVNFKIKRETYIPIMVYKALVKIAITIIPENELQHLEKTILWLKNYDRAFEDYFSQFIMMRFFPGFKPFQFIKAIIFKRKHDDIALPMYQISLSFNNYNFQYIIPCAEKDIHLDGKTVTLRSFPTPFDIGTYPQSIGSALLSLYNYEKIKDEIVPIGMHYESKEIKICE
jgi:hypothetical protein